MDSLSRALWRKRKEQAVTVLNWFEIILAWLLLAFVVLYGAFG